MMRWDPWIKEKYAKWKVQIGRKDQVQLDFYERMKIDEVIRESENSKNVSPLKEIERK